MTSKYSITRVVRLVSIAFLSAVVGIGSSAIVRAEVPPEVLEAEAKRIDVVREASAATISVFAAGAPGGGSGVVITPDGYALTNFHVAQPSGDAMKCGMADGKIYDAVIVSVDPTGDVALIKLFGRDDFPTATLGDSDEVRVGDWAFAIGNPFNLATDFTPSVSYGIISGIHRYQYGTGSPPLLEYADCIQTDAAINPGNSGGPLFDSAGKLIGINGRGSFEKRGRVNVGVGYAISINQIKRFMGYLRSGRIVDHAELGAIVASDEEGRVVVDEIDQKSDAFRRGLRYGDEIIRFGDRAIRTVNALKNVLGTYPKGWQVPLAFRRKGEVYEVLVRLKGTHREGELAAMMQGTKKLPQPGGPPDKQPPGEQPPGEQPPGEQPKRPDRPAAGKPPKPVPMPEIIKEHFEARKGYANYFYNRQNQLRVWESWSAAGDFSQLPPVWQLSGSVRTEAGNGPVLIRLEPEKGEAILPEYHAKAAFNEDLADMLDPPASGGLLVSLHLWARLLSEGIDGFGQVYYLGTKPLVGQDELVDVLVGIHGGVEVHFSFDPQDGRLLAIEMFPDEETDPCEIYLQDYRQVDENLWPHRIQVRYADRLYGDFQFDGFKFSEAKP